MTDVTLVSEDTYGGEDEEAKKAFWGGGNILLYFLTKFLFSIDSFPK